MGLRGSTASMQLLSIFQARSCATTNDIDLAADIASAVAEQREGVAKVASSTTVLSSKSGANFDEEDEDLPHVEFFSRDGQGNALDDLADGADAIDPTKAIEALPPRNNNAISGLARVDLLVRFDSKLKDLTHMTQTQIGELAAEEAVGLASSYLLVHQYAHQLFVRRLPFKNLVQLGKLEEEALMSAAIRAIEDRSISLSAAVRMLRPNFTYERFKRHKTHVSRLMKAWVIEEILAEKIDPVTARKLLLGAKYFSRDARVIGNLAQKAIEDIDTHTPEQVIKTMYAVAETKVKPPPAFWTACLRRIVASSRKQELEKGTPEAHIKAGALGLTPRMCYRILYICEKVGVHAEVNLLTQIAEECWRRIAINANAAKFGDKNVIRAQAAIKRLARVCDMQPHQFFRFMQMSTSLGANFSPGQGVITDRVLIPLVFHLSDSNMSSLLDALAASKTKYAPMYQAVIDRVVFRGTGTAASLIHVSSILRNISRENDLCSQLRLTKFFSLVEDVSRHKEVLRYVQMVRLVEDMYYITRRFNRDAPIVVRLQAIVDSFCSVLVVALERGVAAIDQINRVLELSIMMGMSKKQDKYSHMTELRTKRNELYQGVAPGTYPSKYRDRVNQPTRFFFNELFFMNQKQMLFKEAVSQQHITQSFILMNTAGVINVIYAVNLYHHLHGNALPLSPFLSQMIVRFIANPLRNAKPTSSLEDLSRIGGKPSGQKLTIDDLRILVTALQHNTLPNIRAQSFYLQYVAAIATHLGDTTTLKNVDNMKAHALY